MSTKRKNPAQMTKRPAARKVAKVPEGAAKDAAPKPPRTPKAPRERDPRLPAVAETITKEWHGKEQVVKCLADGFEFKGEHFKTLSAVARAATGAKSINGYLHFGLVARPAPASKKTAKGKVAKADAATDAPAATGEAK